MLSQLLSLTNRQVSSANDSEIDTGIKPVDTTKAASLTIKDLSVSYGDHLAIRDVSLQAHAKQILALVGPSGCGKSSLLASINRMTDNVVGCQVQGDIIIDGRSTAEQEVSSLRKKVAMVFQAPNPFPLSIKENICFVLKDHGIKSKQEREQRMQQVLKQTGLWAEVKDRLDSSALKLSGGQQQRLCIARALVMKPQLLLLDEPCSALDPIASGHIEQLISQLKNTVTIVMVTHNLAQARRIADSVAVCWVDSSSGYVVECDSTKNIFENPKQPITKAYCLGHAG